MPDSKRVALVTGSTSGIGEAVARRLVADGFIVVVHSRSSVEAGQVLARQLGSASYLQADLAEPAQATRLVQDVLARHGRLDVLVNNAGISGIVPHADLRAATPEMWRQIYDVNVIGPWMLIAEAETALRAVSTEVLPAAIRQYFLSCWRAAEGRLDPLRRQQGRAEPYDEAAGDFPGACHPGQRDRARAGRYADDGQLDGDPGNLANPRADAPRRTTI